MLTCAIIACGGNNSITSAPSAAPKIINGKATRKTYQKLFPYDRATLTIACHQLSAIGMSIGHTYDFSSSREAAAGANTKIKNSTVANFNTATLAGNNANVIASTTTFKAGEANIAARTDSLLIPAAYNPRAIRATQFVHTATHMPASAPNREFNHFEPLRRDETIPIDPTA